MALLLFLTAVAAAALTGARFSPGAWYDALVKPPWNPPSWLFGPVWTALYLAIAIAGWRVWRRAPRLTPALGFWIAQLVLNTAWSWLFFGLHRPDLAMVDIALLLLAIVGFGLAARSVDRAAAWLFLPYGLWVAFAASLNLFIWLHNGGAPQGA